MPLIVQNVVVNTRLVPVLVAMLPFGLMACGGDGVPDTAEPGDEFCELAEDANDAGDDLDNVDFSDPDEMEETFAAALEASEDAAAKAPKDIADEINERVELQREVVEALDDVDYDIAEAFEDEDFIELGEDVERIGDEVDEYLEDKCDIEDEEPAADTIVASPDSVPTIGDELPDGLITRDNFLEFYGLGAGVEITQEMKDCFAAETADLSDEDFNGAIDESSEAGTMAIGAAILTCNIPFAD